jgi:carboxynorspermidine decarboxylase
MNLGEASLGGAGLPGGVDVSLFPTPCFVVNLEKLEDNLKVLDRVQQRSGAKILLALKGFAFHPAAPLVMRYLKGTTSSGLHELLLGSSRFGGESHVYSPAYDPRDFDEVCRLADHLVFNTPAQWQRHKDVVLRSGKKAAIRVNPEYSEIEVPMYNPCYTHSRLGTTRQEFDASKLDGITTLHFHTLCEQGSETLERTWERVDELFGKFIADQCEAINFGGGHHITRDGYDLARLERCIKQAKERYDVDVYLEPGEAVALGAGVLVTQVLDVMHNGMDIAILDTSASTHMPDVLEMPYRPHIFGAGRPGEYPFTYRLGGLTCLAGDVIGDYSFPRALKPGDRLVFSDMAHYSMVKTTTFNGVKLPAIASYDPRTKEAKVHREFGFDDYLTRLG